MNNVDHASYVTRTECDVSRIRREFHSTKSKRDAASKKLDFVWNEIATLGGKLEGYEIRLSVWSLTSLR